MLQIPLMLAYLKPEDTSPRKKKDATYIIVKEHNIPHVNRGYICIVIYGHMCRVKPCKFDNPESNTAFSWWCRGYVCRCTDLDKRSWTTFWMTKFLGYICFSCAKLIRYYERTLYQIFAIYFGSSHLRSASVLSHRRSTPNSKKKVCAVVESTISRSGNSVALLRLCEWVWRFRYGVGMANCYVIV